MNILTLIKEALKNLLNNRVRSLLTMLGIFIGVGAVIAMMSVGFGAKNAIASQMSSLGTNTIYVSSGNFSANLWNSKPLTNADAEAIRGLESIEKVASVMSTRASISRVGNKSTSVSIQGVEADYLSIISDKLAEGQFISQENIKESEMVVVIGSKIKELLFKPEENVIGESIRILGQPYRVIGLMEKSGSASMGMNQDSLVYLPLTTVQNRMVAEKKFEVSEITVLFKNGYSTKQVETEIKDLLRERHEIKAGAPDDFTVFNMQQYVDTMNSVLSTFVIFLGGVAGISLLVGGIGIMNIMLVTVTERTREIGLRKALGAKRKDILIQFLVESSVLSLVGGILGIIFGLLLGLLIALIASKLGTSIKLAINIYIVIGTTIFSVLVGLFFGIYPANRASNLEPVIALRTE